jgi:hypothetical protein
VFPWHHVQVRTTPLLGQKAWFGPHRVGWGLSPVSAEGWTATVIAVEVSLWAKRQWPERRMVHLVAAAGLVATAFIKGTAPGGPRARRAFIASRRAAGHH